MPRELYRVEGAFQRVSRWQLRDGRWNERSATLAVASIRLAIYETAWMNQTIREACPRELQAGNLRMATMNQPIRDACRRENQAAVLELATGYHAVMSLQPYTLDELRFAYCFHAYFRWHTHFRCPFPALRHLPCESLQAAHPEIHLLQLESSACELSLLASLQPTESVSTAASKLKGAASKCVRQIVGAEAPSRIMGAGYFACTCGPSTQDELDRYLEIQRDHHGYTRPNPPVFVRTWPESELDDSRLQAVHSHTVVQFHLVFATWDRKGVFTTAAAEAVTSRWEQMANELSIRFRKVSFVADHVHIAIRAHPTAIPARLAVSLLNASQELMRDRFEELLVTAAIPRLWKPSAYLGSFGELASAQIQAYLRRWGREQ